MFKLKESASKPQKSLVESVAKILNKNRISVEKGEYSKKPWPEIFLSIQQISAEQLSLYSNDAELRLKDILSPKFPNLKGLYLSCNHIISIEALGRLQAPNLEELNLITNFITNIRSLRKLCFPNLQDINISQNPITQPECLSEMWMKKMKYLAIEIWPNLNMVGQSKRWIFKLQAKNPQDICKCEFIVALKSKFRRKEEHIDRVLKLRFPKLQCG